MQFAIQAKQVVVSFGKCSLYITSNLNLLIICSHFLCQLACFCLNLCTRTTGNSLFQSTLINSAIACFLGVSPKHIVSHNLSLIECLALIPSLLYCFSVAFSVPLLCNLCYGLALGYYLALVCALVLLKDFENISRDASLTCHSIFGIPLCKLFASTAICIITCSCNKLVVFRSAHLCIYIMPELMVYLCLGLALYILKSFGIGCRTWSNTIFKHQLVISYLLFKAPVLPF